MIHRKSNIRPVVVLLLTLLAAHLTPSAFGVTLTLGKTIELANDSSLMAFRYRNMYQASYWQYISFRA